MDRLRALERSGIVKRVMQDVSFATVKIALPTHCLALMQNVSAEEEKDIRQIVDSLDQLEVEDRIKSLNLGLVLLNVVGPDVLKSAVEAVTRDSGKQPSDDTD